MAKNTFASRTFKSRTFKSGTFAGVGVTATRIIHSAFRGIGDGYSYEEVYPKKKRKKTKREKALEDMANELKRLREEEERVTARKKMMLIVVAIILD